MKDTRIASWSNVLPTRTRLREFQAQGWREASAAATAMIARGSGRSYGDAAYVTRGVTFSSRALKRILAFDPEQGTVVCEPGVQLAELLRFLEPTAWSVPVCGGTRWVTIGGAVASDIHGKNDVAQGSFGHHVLALSLVTADGDEVTCSRTQHPELFAATVGGMGLTGFITQVTLALQHAPSKRVLVQTSPLRTAEEMAERFARSQGEFRVAWVDLTRPAIRGVFHEATYAAGEAEAIRRPLLELDLPTIKLFNRPMVRWLNAARYAHDRHRSHTTHVVNFHYPVDALKYWNRFYGPQGFHEYQFVVPTPHLSRAFTAFIDESRAAGLTPFFVVVKQFGDRPREGLLSFPRPGFTLMADFEHRPENQAFFTRFTEWLLTLDGRTYLAKDSYTLPHQFERMYPRVEEWRAIVRRYDPANRIRSDLSTRLGLKPW